MARRNARSISEAVVRYSGSPRFLGTIDFTGSSKTNGTATTPFNLASPGLAGKVLLLQSDSDCYILPVSSSATAVTATNGVKLVAGERVTITADDIDTQLVSGEIFGWIAALQVSAGGNLKIWELV